MNGIDVAIGVVAGLVGFAVVSWLITVVRQQRAPPVSLDGSKAGAQSKDTAD